MLERSFFSYGWLAAVVWVVLYASDYYLTMYGARLFKAGGSYELNPDFRAEVERNALFSPLFAVYLIGWAAVLVVTWLWSRSAAYGTAAFGVIFGLIALPELPILIRHLNNIASFHQASAAGHIQGPVRYSRPLQQRRSAIEWFVFALFFLGLWLIVGGWVLLGGFVGCIVDAGRSWDHGRRHL